MCQPDHKIVTSKWWLLPLIALSLAGLWFYYRRNVPVTGIHKELQDALQACRTFVASNNTDDLAVFLDRSMVIVPAGEFLRGSTDHRWDERPEQQIYLDAFAIDQYEVTNTQYQRFLLATGEKPPSYWTGTVFPRGQADYPVVGVSWQQASAYCGWAGKRLPTEAEWEKACRGTDGRLYPWGNQWKTAWANLDPLAGQSLLDSTSQEEPDEMWRDAWGILHSTPVSSGGRGLRPVGSYSEGASPYGVLDMAGNASEWVADWYIFADYSRLPGRNPYTSGPEWNHALRGSAWYDPNGSPTWQQDQSRCAARNSSHVPFDARVGFRCACTEYSRACIH